MVIKKDMNYGPINKVTEYMKQICYREWENQVNLNYQNENVLNFPIELSFGIEIEFQAPNINEGYILEKLVIAGLCCNTNIIQGRTEKREYAGWRLMKESSCDWEIISPILHDDKKSWNEILKIYEIIKNDFHGTVDEYCGLHIHIGRNGIFTKPFKCLDLKHIYLFLETFTLGLAAGDSESVSVKRIYEFAATIPGQDKHMWSRHNSILMMDKIIQDAPDFNEEISAYVNAYYPNRTVGYTFNTKSTCYKTVEFRTFNGTLDPIIVQLYIKYISCILKKVYYNESIPYFNDGTCYLHNNKYMMNKEYIDKCLNYLSDDIRERQCFVQVLLKNNYILNKDVVRALEGDYTSEEVKKINP
jgi:hypothetical protein